MLETESKNELETFLESADTSVEGRREFLRNLVKSRVFVLLDQPWDGHSLPNTSSRVMLISDGTNQEQVMLAVFTAKNKTDRFLSDNNPFKYAVEVDAAWALLGIPENAGAIVNPNAASSFRISPEVAGMLRDVTQKNLALRMSMPQGSART